MARPLRIEFPGAIYHVTSRGDRREPIFEDDEDRRALLDVVAQAMSRFDADMVSYCLMGNHYHFVLGTRQANLSRLMRHINGVYTQRYNRRHGKAGHLFQGRFKAILVDRDAYLQEVCRYVELNPVRAGLVAAASDWEWSSYLHHVEQSGDADAQFWGTNLRQQIYLGDEDFVARMQALAPPQKLSEREVSAAHRRKASSVRECLSEGRSREEGAFMAYTQGGFKLREIASELGVSISTVSLMVKRFERGEFEIQK